MSFVEYVDMDEQYARHVQLKPEDVGRLEEWQENQPHLPPTLHPIEVALFLQSCSYSIEAAKNRIETFYAYHTHCPEFFSERDPLGPQIQLALDTWLIATLPDLTPEGYLVTYIRLQDRNPDAFDFNAMVKTFDMVMNLVIKQRGCYSGHILIVDLGGATIRHLLKCHVLSMKKSLMYLQAAVPVIVKSFHIVNVAFMEKLLVLMRPFLGKDLRENLHVHHGDNSSILKFVPREILPIECGGLKLCATDYYKNFIRKEIERHSEYFKKDELLLMDVSKRPGQPTYLDDMFGVEGTFKQLNVD